MMSAACAQPLLSDVPSALVWCDDREPGIRRRCAGKGFTYLTNASRRVANETTCSA
jgi:DNA topoisomerase IB